MMTILLIIVNVIVFFLIRTGKLDADDLVVSYHTVFNRKQYYRIITSAFAHEDITHILFNMISLMNVGSFVESLFGSGWMLVIYFGSMIFGKLMTLMIRHGNHQDYQASIGASGAICGLLGAYFLVVLYVYGLSGIYDLARPFISLLMMSAMPGIDGTSHFSGMAVGMMISFLLLKFL